MQIQTSTLLICGPGVSGTLSAAVKVFRDLSGSFTGEFAPFLSGVAIVDDILIQISWKSSLPPDSCLILRPSLLRWRCTFSRISSHIHIFGMSVIRRVRHLSSCGPRLTEYLVPCISAERSVSTCALMQMVVSGLYSDRPSQQPRTRADGRIFSYRQIIGSFTILN